ncbi:hypothetical protein JDV02_003091 [Purpureocillium takamizusanense]|uniref:Uncharacterized protein n=1 Tax=Purpureocillium takamizusanense TaxID=2060973 RepID=A0A9Q8QCD9_9HYPO|nr:uncharacterized protein JDV02_003091 [Purpureocillium takamizusanense]UNI16677.1 hypothetical protein JDV02_003091 [Purpureocillium takamizusanense]
MPHTPPFLTKTMEKPLQFVLTNPDIFESSRTRPDASSSAPSQKQTQWEPIVRNLLKKLPQSEQAWDRILHTQDDVNKTLQRLILSHLSLEEKAALSWKDLFSECAKHLELLAQDKTEENLIELFRLAVIGLSDVAINERHPRDEIYECLRLCLQRSCKPGQQLGDESLRQIGNAMRRGVQFVEDFTDILGPRSNELPLHVKYWRTTFQHYHAQSRQYVAERKSTVYRPEKQLQSGCLSVINVVYLLLGGECSGRSPRAIRDILLPDTTLASWQDSSSPSGSSLQSCNQISSAPRRGAFVKFFALGHRAIGLKQAAISVILTDVIISHPLQTAKGLYSYGHPLASQKYFNAAVTEKATEIERWMSKHGRKIENLFNLRAEAFRSEQGTAAWPTLGGALVLPLTNEAIDIKLLDSNTGTARRKVWLPNRIMYLEHEGLAAINGSIHYIYALINPPN